MQQQTLRQQAQQWLQNRDEILEGYREAESEGMAFSEDSVRTNPSLLPEPLQSEVYLLIRSRQT